MTQAGGASVEKQRDDPWEATYLRRLAARLVGHQFFDDERAGSRRRDERCLDEVIAIDPRTGYILWRKNVPGAHEIEVTYDGKTA